MSEIILEDRRAKKKRYQHEWYLKNRERLLSKARCYQILWYDRLKSDVLSYYSKTDSPVCVTCGDDRIACLSIDHIDNSGAAHRKMLGVNGRDFYRWLKTHNYPPGYQTLCMNCQFVKDFERRRGNGK